MKKTLSFLLALCLTLSVGFTAFASEKTVSEQVYEQIEGAVAYLTKGVESYGVDDAINYTVLLESGMDPDKFGDGFMADVKKNLEANNGKIIGAYGESLATYGAVIVALSYYDVDPTDFYGYDIVAAFMAMDPADTSFSPNYYRVILEATIYCDNAESFAKSICDTYVSEYYTMGKGVDYYGYSCDNTAYFIDAMSYYYDEYENVINDAYTVLGTYAVKGGYFSNAQYSTEPNTDSTALALMAYCNMAYSDSDKMDEYFEKVNSIYADLCTFEGSSTGVFISSYTGEDDAYATKEALMALQDYYIIALIQEDYDDDETTTKPTVNKNDNNTESTTGAVNKNKSVKSPATGSGSMAAALAAAAFAGSVAFFAARKRQTR